MTKQCPECSNDAIVIREWDYGICPHTGYHDAGEYFQCLQCGARGDVGDLGGCCEDCNGTGMMRSGVCHCGESMDDNDTFNHSGHTPVEMDRSCHCGFARKSPGICIRLKEPKAQSAWRPIAEIHEDLGPCVLIRIHDPGEMKVGNNLDSDFDEQRWTHFVPVPGLTHQEADRLIAQLSSHFAPGHLSEDATAEVHFLA